MGVGGSALHCCYLLLKRGDGEFAALSLSKLHFICKGCAFKSHFICTMLINLSSEIQKIDLSLIWVGRIDLPHGVLVGHQAHLVDLVG